MKKIASIAACAWAAWLAQAPAQAAIVLSFTPSSTSIAIGETVSIDVAISGLGAEILSAADLNFLFGGAATTYLSSSFTGLETALGEDAFLAFDVQNAGELGLIAFSVLDDAELAAQQPDAFSLGSFSFVGAADGATTLSLGADPEFQRNFVGLNALSLQVTVGSACIAVGSGSCTQVPEPASYGLAALALLAATAATRGARRRRPGSPTA